MSKKEGLKPELLDSREVTEEDEPVSEQRSAAAPPENFVSAVAAADAARRKAGFWLGLVSFLTVIAVVGIVLFKMFKLLGTNHDLTAAFIASENAEFRSEILIYLGIIVLGHSIVTVWLIIWCGRMITVATNLYIPVRDLKRTDSMEDVSAILKRIEPILNFTNGKKK